MTQGSKIIIGLAAFALLMAGAVYAYNELRENVKPEVALADPNAIASASESTSTSTSVSASGSLDESTDTGADSSAPETDKVKALDFTVMDADGNGVKLSDMEGKPVVLNFWASWCPPCKSEMPEFDAVYRDLGENVYFMMVDMTDGQRETQETGAEYVAGQGFSFPVYYDIEQDAANSYGIRSIPTTIFIDKDGFIITGAEGQIDEEMLRYGISLIQVEGTEEK